MIDTMVLVYATRSSRADDTSEAILRRQDSRALLATLQPIYLSSITYAEFTAFVRPEESDRAREYLDRTHVVDFGAAGAAIAESLLRSRLRNPKLCKGCWNPIGDPHVCKVCKTKISAVQRRNDIYIAASARAAGYVTTLYTYDNALLSLANEKALAGLAVVQPPPSSGPLFTPTPTSDEAEDAAGEVTPGAKKAG